MAVVKATNSAIITGLSMSSSACDSLSLGVATTTELVTPAACLPSATRSLKAVAAGAAAAAATGGTGKEMLPLKREVTFKRLEEQQLPAVAWGTPASAEPSCLEQQRGGSQGVPVRCTSFPWHHNSGIFSPGRGGSPFSPFASIQETGEVGALQEGL